VRDAFGATPFVWKDPRNCVLLPFWRAVIEPPDAAIFIYRDPLEVARSLEARNRFPVTLGLALWERYNRAAVANLAGMPTLAVNFKRVLDDPEGFGAETAEFLGATGFDTDDVDFDVAGRTVDQDLRHQRTGPASSSELHASQAEFLAQLAGLEGSHPVWTPPPLAAEPGWVGDVLALRFRSEQLRRDQRQRAPGWRERLHRFHRSGRTPG
jgi:hypothetical protein